jgi:hypothetical protein
VKAPAPDRHAGRRTRLTVSTMGTWRRICWVLLGVSVLLASAPFAVVAVRSDREFPGGVAVVGLVGWLVLGQLVFWFLWPVGVNPARLADVTDDVLTVPTLRGTRKVLLGRLKRVRCWRLYGRVFDGFIWTITDDSGGKVVLASFWGTTYPFLSEVGAACLARGLKLSVDTRHELKLPGGSGPGSFLPRLGTGLGASASAVIVGAVWVFAYVAVTVAVQN